MMKMNKHALTLVDGIMPQVLASGESKSGMFIIKPPTM